jgi:brefeldin A-inhibited guanine nucleotide-exchange protein
MLNTDLHNPSIKPEKRMTLDSFIRNNRGIGENGGDLPDEVLAGIFGRIKERPFSLKEDDAARERVGAQKQIFDTSLFFEGSSLFGTSAEQRKRETFKKEKDELMAVTEQLIRRRPEKNTKLVAYPSSKLTDTVAPADVVKPMFDVTWGPMLGILSQVLECSDDEGGVAVCLNGFVYAVRIASHSNMSLARDTFVSSLAKFTFLGSIKEMKKKNVESVRTLLSIAVIDGEYLDESWEPVLQCISQLARLRLSASGLDSDESFLSSTATTKSKKPASTSSRVDIFRPPSRGELARETNENNGKAVLEAVQEVLIDKVFSSTVNLSAKSLARFIEQLIAVAESEIAGNTQPRGRAITGVDGGRSISSSHGQGGPSIYSLQRLVDVAFWNMDGTYCLVSDHAICSHTTHF